MKNNKKVITMNEVNGKVSEASHTPTPWFIIPKDARELVEPYIVGVDQYVTASVYDKTNATFIVRAVNSHEALLEAAKKVLPFLEVIEPNIDNMDQREARAILIKAIALAEGGVTEGNIAQAEGK